MSGTNNNGTFETLTYYRGRVALFALLKALKVAPGDEVATQAFTCIAVPEAIMATGAKPLYIDIESDGFNMDADHLASRLTERTKAVIVQHTFGIPAQLEKIVRVASERGIPIIEDCAHSLASTYKSQVVGKFGAASFYSFEWGKPVAAGIGGAAVVNDPDLRNILEAGYADFTQPSRQNELRLDIQYLAFRVLFRPSLFWPIRSLYHLMSAWGVAESSYNPVDTVAQDFTFKMPSSTLKRVRRKTAALESIVAHSRWVVEQYRRLIHSNEVSHPTMPPDSDVVFVRYPLIARNKQELLQKARHANVEMADWYSTPVHPLTASDWSQVNYEGGSCPNAEIRCRETVTLPTHGAVGMRYIQRASDFLNRG